MIVKHIFFKYLFIVFLFYSSSIYAQLNESDTLDLKAGLALTGVYQAGNVETLIFRAKSDFSIRAWKNWIYKNQNSYVYQAFGGSKADEDILSLNFLYFNPDKKLYPFILAFGSTNFRREIDLRYLLGAGATYQVFKNEQDYLKFSLSSEYEKTDFAMANFNRDEFDNNHIIDTFRGTLWVNGRYHIIDNKLIFNHESYFQPSLEQSNNFRWQTDLGLQLPLWSFLDFKINYLNAYESVVIEGQKQEDRFLTFGFNIKNFD